VIEIEIYHGTGRESETAEAVLDSLSFCI